MDTLTQVNRSLITIFTSCVLAACAGGGGSDENRQFSGDCTLRITNGSRCSSGVGPIVLVELSSASAQSTVICSGAFITTRHILTGAHCFDDKITSTHVIYGEKRTEASEISIPPQYREGDSVSPFDFAIITLSEPAKDVETLPILISDPIAIGDLFNIVGYGQDEIGNAALQGTAVKDSLRKGTMVISEKSSALRAFAAEFNSTGQSVCSGDSGAPAIMVNRDGIAGIIGVAQAVADPSATNEPRCLKDSVAVFTDLQNQNNLEFIRAIVPALDII